MTARPRTLAEWLRSRDDTWLRTLILARPDVSFPPPKDFSTLAQRLAVRVSVNTASDELTAWHAQVLDGLLLSTSTASVADIHAMLPDASAERVSEAIEHLRSLALVWGEDDALNVVGTVRDAASRFVAGLGRPAAELFIAYSNDDIRTVLRHLGLPYAAQPNATGILTEKLRDVHAVSDVLARAPHGSDQVLDRLSDGIPAGELSGADQLVDADESTAPVRWLLSHGMLAYVGPNYLELPREVGRVLRGKHQLGPAALDPPAYDGARLDQRDVDGAGATHLQDAVRQGIALLDILGDQQPRVLRTGGLGARETKKLAKTLGAELRWTQLLLYVAQAAGLLASTSGLQPVWLPTQQYDEWRQQPIEQQWSSLVIGWLDMAAQPWLADPEDSASPHALSDGMSRSGAAVMRHRILSAADALGAGAIADVGSVAAYASWRWPRRLARGVTATIAGTLREAEFLGVTGRGALTSAARALLSDRDNLAKAALASLPEPVDHVMLQADHTAVAPGRPSPGLDEAMHRIADVESAGGAIVFRISEGSLRRAYDSALTSAQIHQILRERSLTAVPQSLTYLVDDISRRHGALRIGGATAYLRCDDETQLDTIVAHGSLSGLKLRRIAPSVVVCMSEPDVLLEALRESGFTPSFENEAGVISLAPQDPPRAVTRASQRVRKSALSPDDVEVIVHQLRSGDEALRARDLDAPHVAGVTTARTLELLSAALRHHDQLSLDYVDENAKLTTRLIVPSRVDGGFLYAYDSASKTNQRFAVHRIVGVYYTGEQT